MKLHTETRGDGPNLFLVHGWALHSGIWNGVLPELEKDFRVTRLDLPGHGLNRELPMPNTLSELAHQLADAAPQTAIWLGWSLGGLVCLRAALDYPKQLRALVLVSTTPRFVTAADWPHAMPLAQLHGFATELEDDYRGTVLRFLALQVRGDATARTTLRKLRAQVFACGEPEPESLATGLKLLRDSDVRAELGQIRLPTLVISGEYDRLTPPQAGIALAHGIPGAVPSVIPKAAHASFLSHPGEFVALLRRSMAKLLAESCMRPARHA